MRESPSLPAFFIGQPRPAAMEVAPASTTLPAMDPADVASAFMPACSDSFLSQDFGTQVRAQACMAVMESSGHSSWPPAESDSHPMEELPSVDQALEALPLQTDRKLRVDGTRPALLLVPSIRASSVWPGAVKPTITIASFPFDFCFS